MPTIAEKEKASSKVRGLTATAHPVQWLMASPASDDEAQYPAEGADDKCQRQYRRKSDPPARGGQGEI